MIRTLRVSCVQMNASENWQKNLTASVKKLEASVRSGAKLVAYPENFIWRGAASELAQVSRLASPQVLETFQAEAARLRVDVLLGSMPEAIPRSRKVYNTSFLIGPDGKIKAHYRKINLFNIALPKVQYHESKHVRAGKTFSTASVAGVPVGLSICYDLRFPELYRMLTQRGARILFVPSHFAYETGKAHWEVLLRARAIENQAFIIAPDQSGVHPVSGMRSFGNSMVVDPWGRVLERASLRGEALLTVDLDLAAQERLRTHFPVLA